MPKQLEKKTPRKRRKSPNKQSGKPASSGGSEVKRRKTQNKVDPKDEISKSRLLASNIKSKRKARLSKAPVNNEARVCGNGKPMPSLAELEKMFEDSDSDGDHQAAVPKVAAVIPTRCIAPEVKPTKTEDSIVMSPNTLKSLANKMFDMISNIPNVDKDKPAPVIPPKKRKKPEVPYIVGCTEREQVPWQPKTSFCKGDEKYGPDKNDGSDEDQCKKRQKRGKKVNISKSIFNAKSDEIAARLKETESSGSSSPDSSKTVGYDYSCNSPQTLARFSPLPSTSRDNDTFLKNDQRFNESLQFDKMSNDSSQDDIEMIEIPCETIILDDPPVNKNIIAPTFNCDDTEDDSCFIVESNIKSETVNPRRIDITDDDDVHIIEDIKRVCSPIQIDSPNNDIYSSLDLCQNYDDDICEIIDVDDVIAENKAIIEKYRKESDLDTIILVEPEPSSSHMSDRTSAIDSEHIITDISDCVPSNNSANADHKKANNIESIVTNFFNNNQSNCSISSDYTVTDLTSVETLNRVTSWISSVPSWALSENPSVANPTRNELHVNNNNINFAISSRFQDNNSNIVSQTNIGTSREREQIFNISDCSRSGNQNHLSRPRDGGYINTGMTVTTVNHNTLLSPSNQRGKKKKRDKNEALPCPEVPKSPKRSIGDCPICMDSLANSVVASTLCGHVFCMGCIKAAFAANGKKCPTCRKKLKGAGYHQLFL